MSVKVLLLSIKPEYANQIFGGKKTVELRRIRTRLQQGDLVFVYVSSPQKSLMGWFEVDWIKTVYNLPKDLNDFWRVVGKYSGLKRPEFDRYYKGASVGIGIFIKNPQVLPKPVKLEELRMGLSESFHPPQNYQYLKPDEIECIETIAQYEFPCFKSKYKQLNMNFDTVD
ncbi:MULTISPECIES: ASCH domain-containing protein [Spirulina sp. CCY15215]|uniref:ASCH domain-containing protein n=1 Tax=Spirulina sp. CCY15215 TaxID=2767591 RepID=UPI0019508F54|nr:ASCH domain-containing protein [Spirulina major]